MAVVAVATHSMSNTVIATSPPRSSSGSFEGAASKAWDSGQAEKAKGTERAQN